MFGSLGGGPVFVPPYLPLPALPHADCAVGIRSAIRVVPGFPLPPDFAERQAKVFVEIAKRSLEEMFGPLGAYCGKSAAPVAGDPDGPLVPLPVRMAPERVVPDFPLTAYRSLVG